MDENKVMEDFMMRMSAMFHDVWTHNNVSKIVEHARDLELSCEHVMAQLSSPEETKENE